MAIERFRHRPQQGKSHLGGGAGVASVAPRRVGVPRAPVMVIFVSLGSRLIHPAPGAGKRPDENDDLAVQVDHAQEDACDYDVPPWCGCRCSDRERTRRTWGGQPQYPQARPGRVLLAGTTAGRSPSAPPPGSDPANWSTPPAYARTPHTQTPGAGRRRRRRGGSGTRWVDVHGSAAVRACTVTSGWW